MTGGESVVDGSVGFREILESAHDSAEFLQQLLRAAVQSTPGAEACGLSLERSGRSETVAYSGELAKVGDERQYELDAGPCLQSLRTGQLVSVADMATETRWSPYPERAVAAGIRSTLSLPLVVGTVARGALNLYATQPRAFSEADHASARNWAAQATGALSVALRMSDQDEEVGHLQRALVSRQVIGQAVGLLMERARCTSETALLALKRQSQESNEKLRDLAQRLVDAHEGSVQATDRRRDGRVPDSELAAQRGGLGLPWAGGSAADASPSGSCAGRGRPG